MKNLLIVLLLVVLTPDIYGQMRYGSCSSATAPDQIYVTPHLGFGRARIDTGFDKKTSTWLGGVTVHYGFQSFKLGLGARYQEYTKSDLGFLKPYVSLEIPIWFSEFEDFGFVFQAGPDFGLSESPRLSGYFIEGGIYFHLVITPNMGWYSSLDYGYNSWKNSVLSTNTRFNVNELKINTGLRFWF